jgi:hypothetical protein
MPHELSFERMHRPPPMAAMFLVAFVFFGCAASSNAPSPALAPRAGEFASAWSSLSSEEEGGGGATLILRFAYDNIATKFSGADWQVLRGVLEAQGARVRPEGEPRNGLTFWRVSFVPAFDPFEGVTPADWYVEFCVDVPEEGGAEFVRWLDVGVRVEMRCTRAEAIEMARRADGGFMVAALEHKEAVELTAQRTLVTAIELECGLAGMSMRGPLAKALWMTMDAESPDGRHSGSWIFKTFLGYGRADEHGVGEICSGGGTMSGPR